LALAILVALAFLTTQPSSAGADAPAIGSQIENFSLPDADGKTHSLNDLRGKNGALIIFLSKQCPIVKLYNERINAIAADYSAKGIAVIGVNSNYTESVEEIKASAADVGYKFPVLIDKNNVLADKLGATFTPEVYYVNAENKLLYHGAIDNDRTARNIEHNYLRAAFDAALSGKEIAEPRTKAFGCDIKRVAKK
jgi:peroxiredoxin